MWQLGNGGTGPYNGLFTLKDDRPEDYAGLSRPFLIPDELACGVITRPKDKRYLEGFEEVELDGCLELADSGCGTFAFLIVTGGQRGMIWGSGGMCELIPVVADDGTPRGFLSWDEDWFDYCLRPEVIAYWTELSRSHGEPVAL